MNEQWEKIVLRLEQNGYCGALDGWFVKYVVKDECDAMKNRQVAFLVGDGCFRFQVRSGERRTAEVYYTVVEGAKVEVKEYMLHRPLEEFVEEKEDAVKRGGWDRMLQPM